MRKDGLLAGARLDYSAKAKMTKRSIGDTTAGRDVAAPQRQLDDATSGALPTPLIAPAAHDNVAVDRVLRCHVLSVPFENERRHT